MAQFDTDVVIVLTTVPVDFDTAGLAQQLLEQRLVACLNVLPPMRSTYWWQGAIDTADERQVVLKTRRECVAALEAALKSRHPYDVPEFLVLPVIGGGDAYLAWVKEETGGERKG
jgi:periplasmic divalent cation tolerance protein